MPESTLAVVIERHGAPEVLVEREVPVREPGPGEVRLSVQAAGINFADLLMRAGLYGTVPPRPYSPGFEVAGVVESVGEGVSGWREGDRAIGLRRYGGYVRDQVIPAAQIFPCPTPLSPVEAAAIPVAFLTAHACLREAASAREGETALILGAAGGVGTAAVQLAIRSGLRVVGTAGSERKRAFVVDELGAEACFDSRSDWESRVRDLVGERGIDVALDPVGGQATRSCRRLLAPLGRLVFYGLSEAIPSRRRSWLRAAWAWWRTPRFHPLSLVEPNVGIFGVHLLHLGPKEHLLRPWLRDILGGVSSGELRPIIDRVFPLNRDGAVSAHTYIHERRNLGKIVLADESAAIEPVEPGSR